jgi:tyrosinase
MANSRIRQDIWTLSREATWHPVIRAYARAVGVLKSRDGAPGHRVDPTSWSYQTAIHWDDTAPAADEFRNKCQHGTWFFLPWHRMYLFHFEAILRSVIEQDAAIDDDTKATWALPYWNYSKDAQALLLPPAFADPMLDGERNPLFDSTRFLNNGESLDPRAVLIGAALRPRRFATSNIAQGFAGSKTGFMHYQRKGGGPLEAAPHGSVHNSVGVNMSQLDTAPADPIFWLHHANIDRLWQVWLGTGHGRANTTDPDWLTGQRFRFHDSAGTEVTMTSGQVLNTAAQLGYTYEDTSAPLEGEAMEPEPDHPAQLVGATDKPVQLTGNTASVRFPIGTPAGPLAAEAEPSRVYLQLDDLTSPDVPRVPYAVYLNVPDDDPATPDDHYVGTASTFGIERIGDPRADHPEGMQLVFDITDLYRSLKAKGEWSNRVSVRFVPLYVRPPAVEPEAELRVAGARQQPGTVDIGQVSVHFQ